MPNFLTEKLCLRLAAINLRAMDGTPITGDAKLLAAIAHESWIHEEAEAIVELLREITKNP